MFVKFRRLLKAAGFLDKLDKKGKGGVSRKTQSPIRLLFSDSKPLQKDWSFFLILNFNVFLIALKEKQGTSLGFRL